MSTTREQLITRAIRDRKIPAGQADMYRRMYDADPAGVTRLFTAPVREGGLMAGIASSAPDPDGYPAEWLGVGAPDGQVTSDGLSITLPEPPPSAPPPPQSRITVEP